MLPIMYFIVKKFKILKRDVGNSNFEFRISNSTRTTFSNFEFFYDRIYNWWHFLLPGMRILYNNLSSQTV